MNAQIDPSILRAIAVLTATFRLSAAARRRCHAYNLVNSRANPCLVHSNPTLVILFIRVVVHA